MEFEKIAFIFASLIMVSNCGISIDTGKLRVPHSSNDLLYPEDDFHDVIKPISYQAWLNPSHNNDQKMFFKNHNLVTFLKPIFNKPLRTFYHNHLKHFARKPIFSAFRIDAGIDLGKNEKIKPIVEHIEDDFKYDFRTDTYSFK